MAWSFSYQGKPADVVKAIEAYSAGLAAPIKAEFDSAKPLLMGLVNQNFIADEAPKVWPLDQEPKPTPAGPEGKVLRTRGCTESPHSQPIVKLQASGGREEHGGKAFSGACEVSMSVSYVKKS